MKKWFNEDWAFTITVMKVGKNNYAEECRLGFEPGDTFESHYECPGGFCPTAMMQMFPLMEAIRCGGDLRILGSDQSHETTLRCPDGGVWLKLSGRRVKS